MILFLPDFECIVGHGKCVGLSRLSIKKWKRPSFLEMYLTMAVAKLFKREIPINYLYLYWTFQAARLGGVSSSITSQSSIGRIKLQGYQIIHAVSTTRIFWPFAVLRALFTGPVTYTVEAE